ncbi:hypothetical protein, partial [Helicobacter typhlonius]
YFYTLCRDKILKDLQNMLLHILIGVVLRVCVMSFLNFALGIFVKILVADSKKCNIKNKKAILVTKV